MTLSGIFVDDQDQQYAKLLSTTDELVFDFALVEPVLTLANKIIAARPAILALDYRLDENANDLDPSETYKAGVLAQQLRDRAIVDPSFDLPIVLVSNEAKIQNLYQPDKTAHDLFDRVYRKEEIEKRRPSVRREVIALATGYEALRAAKGKYRADELLCRNDAGDLLDQQDISAAFSRATAPHTLAKFILKALIDQPGLIVDHADAAARLGIDLSSFELVAAHEQIQPFRYSGPFGDGWQRWWLDALLSWAEGIFGARPISLPNVDRAERLSAALGLQLEPAKSPWTGRSDEAAALACASCREATEIRHSVAAYAPTPFRFTVRPRICWDCIQTDRYRDRTPPLLVDDADADLAESVKTPEARRLAMAIVGAEEAGKALSIVASKLANANILTWDGQLVLEAEAGRLRKLGKAPAWGMEVDRNRPVVFNNSVDKNGAAIRISIDGARIEFQQNDQDLCPVRNLDAAVVIADAQDEPIARWHIDKANVADGNGDEKRAQPGPLFHLQFGGHVAGRRELDLPIKEPRWCHPPLEIALLCEIVAANFFERAWKDSIRDDESWCKAIQLFQRLCWERYFQKKLDCIAVSHSTALGLMWADRWPA